MLQNVNQIPTDGTVNQNSNKSEAKHFLVDTKAGTNKWSQKES